MSGKLLNMLLFAALWAGVAPAAPVFVFDGKDIPCGIVRRAYDVTNAAQKQFSFSLANGKSIFLVTNPASPMALYGGLDLVNEQVGPSLRCNETGFAPRCFFLGVGGTSEPSAVTANLLWRRDQFNLGPRQRLRPDQSANTYLKVRLLSGLSPQEAEVRFVICNGGQFYLSEATTNAAGVFTISGFNNTRKPGLRWGPFAPSALGFGLPRILPPFRAVDFSSITAVGIVYEGKRDSFHHGLSFDLFEFNAPVLDSLP